MKSRALMILIAITGFIFGMTTIAAAGNVDVQKEEEAIKKVIERQNEGWLKKNYDIEAEVWAHEPYIVKVSQSGEEVVGWDAISARYKRKFEGCNPGSDLRYTYSNFHFKIYNNIAWVTHEQSLRIHGLTAIRTLKGWESRILEKRNGKWKIVYQASRFPRPLQPGPKFDFSVDYDVPPMPKGGFEVLQKALKYPEEAKKQGVQGRVIVVVNFDERGQVVNALLYKGICSETKTDADGKDKFVQVCKDDFGCNDAAVQAIKSVAWDPARKNGKPVKVSVKVPVEFRLDDGGK